MIRTKKRQKISRRNQKKPFFLRILFYLFSLAFLGVFFYVLFFSPFLKISSIEIIGNKYVDQKLILDKINPKITGKYFNVLDKNNLLLARTNQMKKDILDNFKIIKNIDIKRKFPSGLIIHMLEREPQMIICSQNQCFILDENGEAYDNIDISNKVQKNNFLILTDKSGKKINFSDIVLDRDYMDYLLGIKEKIPSNFDLEIEKEFQTPTLISGNIKIKTKEGWEIYFNKNINLERELEMLKTVLENGITSEQRKDLEYIDLRIDSKVFYKFRDGTSSQEAKLKADAAAAAAQNPIPSNDDVTNSTEKKNNKKKKD